MYPGGVELRNYIKKTPNPTLKEFILQNSSLAKVPNLTLKQLINLWTQRFSNFLKKYKPELNVDAAKSVEISVWKQFEEKDITTERKSLLFQWFYFLEEKDAGVDQFVESNQEAINEMANDKNKNVTVYLDKLSISLLKAYLTLTTVEKSVLKMSLSYIVDLVDEEMTQVYKRFIPESLVSEWLEISHGPVLSQEERQSIESAVDCVVEKNNQSLKAARAFLFLKLIELDEQDTIECQAYEVLLQIVNMIHQNKNDMKQEMDYVSIVKRIMLPLTNNTNIKLVIGETGAQCTKPVRQYNEESFSSELSSMYSLTSSSTTEASLVSESSVKNQSSRKVDLRVLGEDEEELAFCEFKENVCLKKLQTQESKAIRLNACLQSRLKSQYNLNSELVATNWGCLRGTMYRLTSLGSFSVATKIANISIPEDARLLDATLKTSLVALFEWKTMLCQLNDAIFVAKNRQGSKRDHYEGMPHALLSPKRVCRE